MNLRQAVERQNKCILLSARDITHLACGVMESSDDLNEANQQVVLAMQEAYGSVYLGKMNPSSNTTYGALECYRGQPLYNSCCDFCVPAYSEELEEAIHRWNKTGSVRALNKIYKIVERLHGIILVWS